MLIENEPFVDYCVVCVHLVVCACYYLHKTKTMRDQLKKREEVTVKYNQHYYTRYWPKSFTTHVNDTSRPCVTVKLSNGAKNSGFESDC